MSRAITIGQIGAYAQEQAEKLLRAAVLETDGMLKQASPVDTGRFRMSWQVGENSASSTPAPEGSYPSAPSIMRVGYQQERLGNLYSVHNNLPYAKKLADGAPGSGSKMETRYNPTRQVKNWASPGGGSSFQTNGPGWIDNIANDIRTRVRDAAERIGRES